MAFWKKILVLSAEAAGMKVLNQQFFQFTPEGITGYLLLSTSHISMHTWPEHGYVACDVFSCGGDRET
jgi:S-adenosylmethionine decarboxylase proenzyme